MLSWAAMFSSLGLLPRILLLGWALPPDPGWQAGRYWCWRSSPARHSSLVLGEDRYDDVYSPPEASPSVDRTLSWIRVAVALCVVAALVTLPTVFTGLS